MGERAACACAIARVGESESGRERVPGVRTYLLSSSLTQFSVMMKIMMMMTRGCGVARFGGSRARHAHETASARAKREHAGVRVRETTGIEYRFRCAGSLPT